jgi:hypothetical protein
MIVKLSLLFLFMLVSQALAAEPLVAYLTDLEGSRQRFEQFLRQSGAFELRADGKSHLKDGAQFVFGGDAPDRYLGSRYVVSELVRLKEENPERVTLIMGNRDLNKMRLTSELSAEALTNIPIRFDFTNEEEWRTHRGPESRDQRLRYIFSQTMGAARAFELRRQEITQDEKRIASDEDVVESFLQELRAGGKFRRFLELGQLAHRIGNTLFVHGGVTAENLGLVPGLKGPPLAIDDWIRNLNEWLQKGIKLWSAQKENWSGLTLRPEQPWLDYPMPNPGMNSKPTSVVTGRNSGRKNHPLFPAPFVVAELLRQGIERILIGHTPTGDYPVTLRLANGSFEVISADNSFSQSESFASVLHLKGNRLRQMEIRGKVLLANGQAVEVSTDLTLGVSDPVGQTLHGSYLIGRLVSAQSQLVGFHYGDQFKIINEIIPEGSLDPTELHEADSACEQTLSLP